MTIALICSAWLASSSAIALSADNGTTETNESAQQADGPALKFVKPIVVSPLEKEELIAAPLDGDVYESTRGGLPDVRVLDAAGASVPYLIRKSVSTRDETSREFWPPRNKSSATPLENDGLEITLNLDPKEPFPHGVRLISPLKNFEHRVRVELSTDGHAWQPLTDDGLIFDYARYIDVRNDLVHWNASPNADDVTAEPAAGAPPRRIRITIDNVTDEQESQLLELTRRLRGADATQISERLTLDRRPFRIDRIEFWRDQVRHRVNGEILAPCPLTDFQIATDAKTKQSHITVHSRRQPVALLTLVTPDRNFSRRASVAIHPSPTGPWHDIGSETVSRIDFRSLNRSELKISLPETRETEYRVSIENRDSPPLDVTAVTAEGPIYEVVFLGEPRSEYRLTYGGRDVPAPDFDLVTLKASLDAGYAPLAARLGEQGVLSEEAVVGQSLLGRWLNDTRLFTLVIGVLVVLLGIVLYQASRRVSSQLD